MKKGLIVFVLCLVFLSCDGTSGIGTNNMDEMPANLKSAGYINYDADDTVIITDNSISVFLTSTDPYAAELSTAQFLEAGYTIEDQYDADDDIYTLTFTKSGSPEIEFVFGIYYPYDISIEKIVDGVTDEDFSVFFTWDFF